MKRNVCAVTLFLFLWGAVTPVTAAANPVAGATLGVVLGNLMDQVQQAIITARNAGLTVEMEAGRQAALTIENARNAYADSLNLTMDRVDATTLQTINHLDTVVQSVSNNSFGNLNQLVTKLQQVANSLPFRPHEPQLSSFSPRYLAPTSPAADVELTFSGNFEFAAKAGFEPTLVLSSKTYSPSSNTTQELKFLVKAGDLFLPEAFTKRDTPSSTRGTLTLPWRSKRFGGLSHPRVEDTYNVIFTALPASLGKITVAHTTKTMRPETKTYTSQEYYQSSASDRGNNDDIDHPYGIAPESGYRIVQSTSTISEVWGTGDRSHSFVSDSGGQVQYNVTTIHHKFGTSGQTKFKIAFDETRDVEHKDTTTQTVDLNWGDSRTFPYESGSWHLVFDAFDKHHFETDAPSTTNPYLKVADNGKSLVLTAVAPTN